MRLEEPRWWYDEQPGLLPRLLAPAALLWGMIAQARYHRTMAYRSRLPVICVGNLTAGGAGKTPLAMEIAARLVACAEHPAFLSRGYGGKCAGPQRVDPERDRAAEVGDEPLLLARHAPTFVARDRVAGARLIEQSGASVIVLDDGLQNASLAKDLSLAVIDGERGIGNGRVMPSGPLRAALAFQLELADALVLSRGDGGGGGAWPQQLSGRFDGPLLQARTVADRWQEPRCDEKFVAYAGIGRPQKFFATAALLGLQLTAKVPFPDHHVYSDADARRLLDLAGRQGAQLLTTDKDLVRLAGAKGLLARLHQASRALPIRCILDGADGERLQALLIASLRAHTR